MTISQLEQMEMAGTVLLLFFLEVYATAFFCRWLPAIRGAREFYFFAIACMLLVIAIFVTGFMFRFWLIILVLRMISH